MDIEEVKEEEEIKCDLCKKEIGDDSYEGLNHDTLCQDCFSENYYSCDNCGNLIENDDEKDGLCNSCWNDKYFECEMCGNNENQNSRYIVEGDNICQSCLENETQYCNDCDETYYSNHFDNPRYHSCENESEKIIHSYSYKPAPTFYPRKSQDNLIYYGVELEVESQDTSCNESAETLENIKEVYCKDDSSLKNGFEVVTHPLSLTYHRNSKIWENISKNLIRKGCKSHDTTTCGIHVHMSRNEMDAKHIKKFVLFWYTQNKIIKAIARRGYNNYCENKNMGRGIIPSNEILRSNSRYEQINLQPYDTIEIRRFKGTLNPVTILACIELVDISRKFTGNQSYKMLRNETETEKNFLTHLFQNKKSYPNLFEKLTSKLILTFESERE